MQIDRAVKTLLPADQAPSRRMSPAAATPEAGLTDVEKRHAAALMRVNHVGEVCAQALYQGQALTATRLPTRTQLQQAAAEELDHLSWCHQRIVELGGHTSYLNPLWYAAAFSMGAVAGAIGDRWSLGFVAETEQQVVAHLQGHLEKLALADSKTRIILQQMAVEESHHASTATAAGAAALPLPVKLAMRFAAKVMTTVAYYL